MTNVCAYLMQLCDPGLLQAFENPNESEVFNVLVMTGADVNLPTSVRTAHVLCTFWLVLRGL